MDIALGVYVGVDEVTAALVDSDLPELGPVAARTTLVAGVPGGIGDAVTTLLGIMRVLAMRNDLIVSGSAIVCDAALHGSIVDAALANHRIDDVEVIDLADPRLSDVFPPAVGAALVAAVGSVAGPAEGVAGVAAGSEKETRSSPRAARLTMVGLGVAVLAALSGATVWALTTDTASREPVGAVTFTPDVTSVRSTAPLSPSAAVLPAGLVPSQEPDAVDVGVDDSGYSTELPGVVVPAVPLLEVPVPGVAAAVPAAPGGSAPTRTAPTRAAGGSGPTQPTTKPPVVSTTTKSSPTVTTPNSTTPTTEPTTTSAEPTTTTSTADSAGSSSE